LILEQEERAKGRELTVAMNAAQLPEEGPTNTDEILILKTDDERYHRKRGVETEREEKKNRKTVSEMIEDLSMFYHLISVHTFLFLFSFFFFFFLHVYTHV
jgi:hypothetical protein